MQAPDRSGRGVARGSRSCHRGLRVTRRPAWNQNTGDSCECASGSSQTSTTALQAVSG